MRIRLTAAVGMAAALLCLTACRSSPDVAAYVGDTKISEQRVTELLDGYNKAPETDRISRSVVVQFLVHDELCQQLSKAKGFAVSPPALPNEAPEFAVIATRADACMKALPPPAQKPTDEDYRALYDRAIAAELIPAGTPFEQVKQQWRTDQDLNALIGREKALNESANVTVNPRYGQMTVVGFNPAVAARLGGGTATDVVVDRPLPAPTGQPQQ